MANFSLPAFTDRVDQRFFIEPTGGPAHPTSYLDRFPDEVYNKAIDSHLVRLMYALLGPAGVGWLKKNYLDAKLRFMDAGFETFDIERYYGDPFRFGRILSERYDDDPDGLLPRDDWNRIKALDEAYRTRALTYFNAVRLGTSPEGVRLAAQSGVGHEVEIVENYKALFDTFSDDPKGFEFVGRSTSTEEFIVLPRLEVSRSERQRINIQATSGTFRLGFQGNFTTDLDVTTVTPVTLKAALGALSSVGGSVNVSVSGGPKTFDVTWKNALGGATRGDLDVQDATNGTVTAFGIPGEEASRESVLIEPELLHNMQTALDFLRPVNSYPTTHPATGLYVRQPWSSVAASSGYVEVIRFVTGQSRVDWPTPDKINWIEASVEKEAPRVRDDRQYHYVGFHNVKTVTAYTDEALDDTDYQTDSSVLADYRSVHIGRFDFYDVRNQPLLGDWTNDTYEFSADRVLADYAEPLTVTTQASDGTALVNGIYPLSYADLPGTDTIKYRDEQFWASRERTSGAEILELDLGSPQAVNYLVFEALRKPVDIAIAYDALDLAPARTFAPVAPINYAEFPTGVYYTPETLNPWQSLEFNFTDGSGLIPLTRFIRITFTRRISDSESGSAFANPWAVAIRNLRIGRNSVI